MPTSLQPPDQSVTPQERRIRKEIKSSEAWTRSVLILLAAWVLPRVALPGDGPIPDWVFWMLAAFALVSMLEAVVTAPKSMPKLGKPGATYEIRPKQVPDSDDWKDARS